MVREQYEVMFRFRGNRIHDDILEEYKKRNPKFERKADVFRHAIVLLDKDMRQQDGQDDLSILIKKVGSLEKAENKTRMQMDVLIKLILELLARSGIDLTWEDAEHEIRDRIGSAVTKKSEVRNVKPKRQVQVENHFEEKLLMNAKKEEEVIENVSTETSNTLQPISNEDKIKLIDGVPHKSVWRDGKEYFAEIAWEQIPKHRRNELL